MFPNPFRRPFDSTRNQWLTLKRLLLCYLMDNRVLLNQCANPLPAVLAFLLISIQSIVCYLFLFIALLTSFRLLFVSDSEQHPTLRLCGTPKW